MALVAALDPYDYKYTVKHDTDLINQVEVRKIKVEIQLDKVSDPVAADISTEINASNMEAYLEGMYFHVNSMQVVDDMFDGAKLLIKGAM